MLIFSVSSAPRLFTVIPKALSIPHWIKGSVCLGAREIERSGEDCCYQPQRASTVHSGRRAVSPCFLSSVNRDFVFKTRVRLSPGASDFFAV